MGFKIFTLALLFCSFFILSNAQPPVDPPGGPTGPGGPPPSGAVPVDAGLGILLAAGAGYGVKKVYDFRKKSKKAQETGIPKE